MKLLHPHTYRSVPWRNGGGSAREIHVAESTHDDHAFDWRASLAVIDSDSPFSAYPGVDRSLVLLGKTAATLTSNRIAVAMTADSAPFAFSGEDHVEMTLSDGPVLVFNLMSRRGVPHRLRRVRTNGATRIDRAAKTQMVFALDDTMHVDGVRCLPHSSVVIAPHGTDPHARPLDISFAGRGEVLIAEIA